MKSVALIVLAVTAWLPAARSFKHRLADHGPLLSHRTTNQLLEELRGGGKVSNKKVAAQKAARSPKDKKGSPKAANKKPQRGKKAAAALAPSGGTASIPNEVFNLVKAIVGVGVLSLPAGIAAFGDNPTAILPALGLITVIGILSAYGFYLIGATCAYTGATSYRGAWSESVGPGSSWIPAWSTTLKTSLACTAFSMVLRDTFSALMRTDQRLNVLLGITGLVLLPLCWMKNLASLAPFSLLGVMGMAYTATAMTVRFLDGSYVVPEAAAPVVEQVVEAVADQAGEAASVVAETISETATAAVSALLESVPKEFQPSFGDAGWESVLNPKSLIFVCMLSTAYMAHFNAPKFYLELKDNTLPRYNSVVSWSFGLSILLMGFITAVGFLTFGGNCQGLVLSNYATTDVWMSVARVAVAVSLVFSYPLAFQGCRDGWLDLLKVPREKRSNAALNLTTLVLLGTITAAAASLKDVSIVLAFSGATLGNALTYVYPAVMFGGTVKKLGLTGKGFQIFIANLSALLGIVMGAIGAKKALEAASA